MWDLEGNSKDQLALLEKLRFKKISTAISDIHILKSLKYIINISCKLCCTSRKSPWTIQNWPKILILLPQENSWSKTTKLFQKTDLATEHAQIVHKRCSEYGTKGNKREEAEKWHRLCNTINNNNKKKKWLVWMRGNLQLKEMKNRELLARETSKYPTAK